MGARSVLWISAADAMTGIRRAEDEGGGLPRLAGCVRLRLCRRAGKGHTGYHTGKF